MVLHIFRCVLSLLTYRALDCLALTCFYVYLRRSSVRTWTKVTQRPGTVATRHGRVVVVPFSLGRLDPRTSRPPRCSNSLLSASSTSRCFRFVNDHTRQRLAHTASYAHGIHGCWAFKSLGDPPTTPHRCPRRLVLTIGAGCSDIAYGTEVTRETVQS